MKSKQPGLTAELNEMIRKALEQPGVAAVMQMYDKYQKVLESSGQDLRLLQPKPSVSDSSV